MKNCCFSLTLSAILLLSAKATVTAQEVLHIQNGALLAIQNGATMSVAGGIGLDNGSVFLQGGVFVLKSNGSSGPSDWIDHTTTIGRSYGNGLTIFNGTGNQTVNSLVNFGSLRVQTHSLSLSNNLRCQNLLLAQGPVNTNGFDLVVNSPADTSLKADPSNPNFVNSWINGKLKRFINPISFNRYDFPVGSSSTSQSVTVNNVKTNGLGNTNTLEVSFGPKAGTDAGLTVKEDGTAFVSVNNGGVWHLIPDQEPIRGSFDLQLSFSGFTGLADDQFGILQRSDTSTNAADWAVPAGSARPAIGAPGRTVANGFAQQNSLSVFGQFGIGMTGVSLPVTLLNFDARRIPGGMVNLEWQTILEENNKGFGIERKQDNENSFSSRGFVASVAPGGNSDQVLNYQYADANNYFGISYYRLRQEDLDGNARYSSVRAVSGTSSNQVTISLYPNPGHGQFNLRIDGTEKVFQAMVTDQLGRAIRVISVQGNSDVQVDGLPAGLYFLTIPDVFGSGRSFVEKVLVIR